MLNRKGFAITAVLYGLLILFVLLVSSYLLILSARKNRVDELVSDIEQSYLDNHKKNTEDPDNPDNPDDTEYTVTINFSYPRESMEPKILTVRREDEVRLNAPDVLAENGINLDDASRSGVRIAYFDCLSNQLNIYCNMNGSYDSICLSFINIDGGEEEFVIDSAFISDMECNVELN